VGLEESCEQFLPFGRMSCRASGMVRPAPSIRRQPARGSGARQVAGGSAPVLPVESRVPLRVSGSGVGGLRRLAWRSSSSWVHPTASTASRHHCISGWAWCRRVRLPGASQTGWALAGYRLTSDAGRSAWSRLVQIHPISVARSTAWARSSTPSLAYTWCRWDRMVLVVTPSSSAMTL
jgi:hypothetical protein